MYPEKVATTNHFLAIECIWLQNVVDFLTHNCWVQAKDSSNFWRCWVGTATADRFLSEQNKLKLFIYYSVHTSLVLLAGRLSKMALCHAKLTSLMIWISVVPWSAASQVSASHCRLWRLSIYNRHGRVECTPHSKRSITPATVWILQINSKYSEMTGDDSLDWSEEFLEPAGLNEFTASLLAHTFITLFTRAWMK